MSPSFRRPVGVIPSEDRWATADVSQRLHTVVSEINRRLQDSIDRAATFGTDHRIAVTDFVARNCPDLSAATLTRVRAGCPRLEQSHGAVLAHAAHVHKTLGVFAGTEYRQALSDLRAAVVLAVMQDDIGPWHDRFSAARNDHQKLVAEQARFAAAADRLTSAQDALSAAQKRGARVVPPRYRTGATALPTSDDSDLWINWALGVPTSPRTLVWDMLMDGGSVSSPSSAWAGGGGSFDGGGASGSWEAGPPGSDPSGSSPSGAFAAAAVGGGALLGAEAAGIGPSFDLASSAAVSPNDPWASTSPDALPSFDDHAAGEVDTNQGAYS